MEGSREERGWDGMGGKSIPTAADIVAGERSFPGNCDRRRWIESIGVVGGGIDCCSGGWWLSE